MGACCCSVTFGADLAGTYGKKKKDDDTVQQNSGPKKTKEHGPGLLTRMWEKFHPAEKPAAAGTTAAVERQVGKSRVQLSMSVDPQPVKLSESRTLKVTLHVFNHEKKLVQLEFPTTQRIEVLVKDKVGKLVEQWSEDRTFANDPGMVSINPGEHLEYSATISTRDLVAGQTYTVEALFPNYESLRLQHDVVAEK